MQLLPPLSKDEPGSLKNLRVRAGSACYGNRRAGDPRSSVLSSKCISLHTLALPRTTLQLVLVGSSDVISRSNVRGYRIGLYNPSQTKRSSPHSHDYTNAITQFHTKSELHKSALNCNLGDDQVNPHRTCEVVPRATMMLFMGLWIHGNKEAHPNSPN